MTSLSIITINYNNLQGLKRTLQSVSVQRLPESMKVEHVIVDGASSDGAVDVIEEYAKINSRIKVHFVSEHDSGIYNAMNKGIRMVQGKYIQVLNSGDTFASDDVIERMAAFFSNLSAPPRILYGNMVRIDEKGKETGRSGEIEFSLRQFFVSTLNHDCCWMQKSLFDEFGLYDENLKIVSDWKWFTQVIALGGIKPVYVNIDVTHFDCTGVSETNLALRESERRKVLEEVLSPAVLADYDRYSFVMEQVDRLKKYHVYGLFYFIERVFFKLEKWHIF